MPPPDSSQFYEELPVLETFFNVSDPRNYHALPDDWYVGMTDIVNSTAAIEKNLYKRVNILGASAIIGLKNKLHNNTLPYSFGGDGCTICFPPNLKEQTHTVFTACKQIGKKEYELNLRAAIIPVSHLREKGFDVRVARFRVSEFYSQAVFMGGGLNSAEDILKSTEKSPFHISDAKEAASADFSGLECRWEEVKHSDKSIISLLVRCNPDNESPEDVYKDVLTKMRGLFGFDDKTNPITASDLHLTLSFSQLMHEIKFRTFGKSWFGRLRYLLKVGAKNLLGKIFMNFDVLFQNIDWGQYKTDLVKNCDYRKFDDMLRLVISGTPEQHARLEEYLQRMHERALLAYGIHSTPSAMVTCMIFNYDQQHIHFVDGGNGGYVQAAKALKERLDALK